MIDEEQWDGELVDQEAVEAQQVKDLALEPDRVLVGLALFVLGRIITFGCPADQEKPGAVKRRPEVEMLVKRITAMQTDEQGNSDVRTDLQHIGFLKWGHLLWRRYRQAVGKPLPYKVPVATKSVPFVDRIQLRDDYKVTFNITDTVGDGYTGFECLTPFASYTLHSVRRNSRHSWKLCLGGVTITTQGNSKPHTQDEMLCDVESRIRELDLDNIKKHVKE